VVGLPDAEWGERVAAAVVLRVEAGGAQSRLSLEDLRAWARDRLAPYKLPTRLAVLPALPRNAMGKILKAEVRRFFLETIDPA
jgi:malonyl-CoA/methylmalonyl-CoA synthetase